mgnify:FL=1
MYSMNELRAYRRAHRAITATVEVKVNTNFANLICRNTGVTQVKPELKYQKVEAKFDKQNRREASEFKRRTNR